MPVHETDDMSLFDKFGRQITDLRISVTDRCNFRCVYCRSADPENYREHDDSMMCSGAEALETARLKVDVPGLSLRLLCLRPLPQDQEFPLACQRTAFPRLSSMPTFNTR